MAKLSYEDKKEIVRLYDEEHYGYGTIAARFNVRQSTIQYLVRKYHIHGESSLKKQENRYLSPEIKLEIIQRFYNGESKLSLVCEYNVTAIQIINWLNNYEKLGYDGLKDKPKGRPPDMTKKKTKATDPNDKDAIIKAKDERILELEAEVEALKKLRALVLQRNKQQTEKKQE